jgi:hypothetical protein
MVSARGASTIARRHSSKDGGVFWRWRLWVWEWWIAEVGVSAANIMHRIFVGVMAYGH